MGKIRVLNIKTSNKIAAGEVIERPASVVKELVDNALDAKANKIFIEIQNGGSQLIKIQDNGIGMDSEDALLCFETHGTSKIHNIEDLNGLNTYGFRGEAIPSIASVSSFHLNTKRKGEQLGIAVHNRAGIIQSSEDCSCPDGTRIIVKDLFFNVPVRKKFLKSHKTEESHIYEIIILLALSHPEVSFQAKFDNRTVLNLIPKQSLSERASFLFGRTLINNLLPIDYTENGFRVYGLIAPAHISRKSRKEQRIFFHQRPINAPCVYNALKNIYHGKISKGEYAPSLLFFDIPKSQIDFNVHPTKKEIRFSKEDDIIEFTQRAIASILEPEYKAIPVSEKLPIVLNKTIDSEQTNWEAPQKTTTNKLTPVKQKIPKQDTTPNTTPSHTRESIFKPQEKPITPKVHKDNNYQKELQQLIYLGQLDRFIINLYKENILLIDKNFAQQRILFEKLKNEQNSLNIQPLLVPISLELNPSEHRNILECSNIIKKYGITIEEYGESQVIISTVPQQFPIENIENILREIISEISQNKNIVEQKNDDLLIQTISRKASSSKKKLDDEDAIELTKKLYSCNFPYSCPNGKAIMISISKSELYRRFGIK